MTYLQSFNIDVNPSLCDELKQCKNNLFNLAHLYSKMNEVQKRFSGINVAII